MTWANILIKIWAFLFTNYPNGHLTFTKEVKSLLDFFFCRCLID